MSQAAIEKRDAAPQRGGSSEALGERVLALLGAVLACATSAAWSVAVPLPAGASPTQAAQSGTAPGPIAYASQAGIRTVAPDGTGGGVLIAADNLQVSPGQLGFPTWSPDGRHIAYGRYTMSSAGYGVDEIWVADADGTNRHLVERADPRSTAMNPAWSPDGRRLAYNVVGAIGHHDHQGIWVMHRDGTHKRWLGHRGQQPSWSADGRLIAFRKGIQANGLAVMRPDGTGYRRLGYGHSTRWLEFSPTNPRQLAYAATGRIDPATRRVDPTTRGVFILDIRRGVNRQIPPPRTRSVGQLSVASLTWTPDGRRLAFLEDAAYPVNVGTTYVTTMRLDGRRQRRLLQLPDGGFDFTWRRAPMPFY